MVMVVVVGVVAAAVVGRSGRGDSTVFLRPQCTKCTKGCVFYVCSRPKLLSPFQKLTLYGSQQVLPLIPKVLLIEQAQKSNVLFRRSAKTSAHPKPNVRRHSAGKGVKVDVRRGEGEGASVDHGEIWIDGERRQTPPGAYCRGSADTDFDWFRSCL